MEESRHPYTGKKQEKIKEKERLREGFLRIRDVVRCETDPPLLRLGHIKYPPPPPPSPPPPPPSKTLWK